MSNELDPIHNSDQPVIYQIRIKGYLSRGWTDWFEGLTITLEEDGDTLLTGPVIDQAALHGLLKKVRDLGLPLVSVSPVDPGQVDAPDVKLPARFNEIHQSRSKKDKEMNTTKGSPLGTNKSTTGIDPKVKLSLLWIFVVLQ